MKAFSFFFRSSRGVWGVFEVNLHLRNASRTNKTEWSRIVRVAQREASTGERARARVYNLPRC